MNMTKDQVLSKLKTVQDPEIGIDVVSLGFIYKVEVDHDVVKITYSLTTPGCPMARMIEQDMRIAVKQLVQEQEIDQEEEPKIEFDLVFEPAWTPEKMSDEAKEKLGWDGE